MEKCVVCLIVFFLVLFHPGIHAQEINFEDDSLKIYLDKNNFTGYFRKIKELSEKAFLRSDLSSLSNLGVLLQNKFGELNVIEKKELRKSAMVVSNKIWRLSGDYNNALSILLVAHQQVEDKRQLDSMAWYVENVIAAFYTMQGDYENADYYSNLTEQSLKHHKMHTLLSRFYTNLGRKFISEQNYLKAINTFQIGLHLADSTNYSVGKFSNAINLAELFNDHPELGSSDDYLLKAEEYILALPADKEKQSILYLEQAKHQSNRGNFVESIRLYREAIQKLNEFYTNSQRREFAKYYTSFARTCIKGDSLDLAIELIRNGLSSLIPDLIGQDVMPSKEQLYPENSFIDLFDLNAQLYEELYRKAGNDDYLDDALANIELALYVNDLIRETLIADPSKLITIRNNKKLIERGISILYDLYNGDNSDFYFTKARSYFDRSKSLLYGEKNRRNQLADQLSDTDRERWSDLLKQIMDLYNQKFKKDADLNTIAGQILNLQQQVNQIFEAYEDVPFTINKPQNYIEYCITENLIYGISEVDSQRTFKVVGSQENFKSLANRLNEFIMLKGLSLDEDILNELFSFLVQPFANQLPGRMVIIPDGAIGYVPFEMLKDDYSKYLLEYSEISYQFEYINYSISSQKPEEHLKIFCLAPIYKSRQVEKNEATRGSIYALPYAKMEVDSIQNIFGESVLISQTDDKAVWIKNITESRVFHYAGHAIIKGDKAYLALNDSEDEKQQLTSKEVSLMHNSLDLVVLSACETGLGKLEQGEGIRSLGRSFMESGAQATVISLWNVNDKSTAGIMTNFYRNLNVGMRKDEALRQAKLKFLKTASKQTLNPYFWAAFIPAGNMEALH